ncbi:cell division protein FtsW [Thalassobaculum fulvum]|uniref:Probable peptidoglycan glycosyltransferase FtsW n=1 Tax=Thalassobaculum fulvum TaxID=1633335 RepID=A0A918XTE6_9PROT|nr:putative peptidoglycan glycosyltransferase FtsW [Thalassobaculum fulvum]GHD54081.1 cell division protein FtsW [Thalassobaculum fulvum]
MSAIARTDTSVFGKWWWTVDRWTLGALFLLVLIGALLILAASPAVAERIGLNAYHFVQRQFVIMPVALALMVAVSLLSPLQVRRLSVLGFAATVVLLLLVPLVGAEIKGATRWISLAGFSLQPSEFAKPFFAVVTAWMFAEWRRDEAFPGHLVAIGLYLMTAALLLSQPDLGMTVVVSAIWFGQFFLAGLPMILVVGFIATGVFGLIGAYFLFPHVSSRIDRFLDPSAGDSYQVDRSLEAFMNGGLLGTGPGEGTVKAYLPDAHADFIFSVAGEEFGGIACLVIIALYAFVVLRGYARLLGEQSLFVLLAGTGLLTQFALQALIHMASSVHLMPAKGMTLPFVSYGGSSLLALGLGMGMALALTRKRFGGEDLP